MANDTTGKPTAPETTDRDHAQDEQVVHARREALKRLGLLGAATAPVLLDLLNPNRAAAVSVSSGATGLAATLPAELDK